MKLALSSWSYKDAGEQGEWSSLQSTCGTNVTEVEKEIVLSTFLKLLSNRSEKKFLSYV